MAAASTEPAFDIIVVGAGFSGLYMLHRLRELGFSVRVIEAGSDVGGTWYWNRYPGCRCDVESQLYSYSFSDELTRTWNWSERFATQPEILSYLNHVADRFALRAHIRFDTRIAAAHFDGSRNQWTLTTTAGEQFRARFCVMATGCLSAGRVPDIPGLQDFRGAWFHTGAWPQQPPDFDGKQVAVLGTGSTGIQLIPPVAQTAAHCYVFQRTPSFSAPARNAPLQADFVRRYRDRHRAIRELARHGEIHGSGDLAMAVNGEPKIPQPGAALTHAQRCEKFEQRWQTGGTWLAGTFSDQMLERDVNDSACEFVREKIRSAVADPAVAAKLSPQGYPFAAKRLCLDTDYYATFNRANVTLVDALATPIAAITPTGLRTREQEYAVDTIIFATGFDAMTGALLAMDIRGRAGASLREHWQHGPQTYLGICVAGFPNLFLVTGPGSPSVLSNMAISIEQHVEWIADLLAFAREHGHANIEADGSAQADWVAQVNAVADATLFPVGNSWYSGANIAGKPRVFMPYVGGVGAYRDICDRVAATGYSGLHLQ